MGEENDFYKSGMTPLYMPPPIDSKTVEPVFQTPTVTPTAGGDATKTPVVTTPPPIDSSLQGAPGANNRNNVVTSPVVEKPATEKPVVATPVTEKLIAPAVTMPAPQYLEDWKKVGIDGIGNNKNGKILPRTLPTIRTGRKPIISQDSTICYFHLLLETNISTSLQRRTLKTRRDAKRMRMVLFFNI